MVCFDRPDGSDNHRRLTKRTRTRLASATAASTRTPYDPCRHSASSRRGRGGSRLAASAGSGGDAKAERRDSSAGPAPSPRVGSRSVSCPNASCSCRGESEEGGAAESRRSRPRAAATHSCTCVFVWFGNCCTGTIGWKKSESVGSESLIQATNARTHLLGRAHAEARVQHVRHSGTRPQVLLKCRLRPARPRHRAQQHA